MTMGEREPRAPTEAPQPGGDALKSRGLPPSPALSAGWLLRAAAFAGVAAGIAGIVVAPGVRGNAGETVVTGVERISSILAYFLALLLLILVVWGALELLRSRAASAGIRVALAGSSLAVLALLLCGLFARLEEFAVLLSAGATVAAMTGAYASARTPHTRALAGILLGLAFAAIARLGAFELAKAASERASVQLYSFGRGLATTGVVFESLAQLAVVTWLWTRSKLAGQLGATAALFGALALMRGAHDGVHSGAALWQAMLHTALGDAAGIPVPYWIFERVAVFMMPASLLLALVAASQPKQVIAVIATVSLALVARGAFDAPLRALCIVVAAEWAALAGSDERAMWRTLLEDRKRRLKEEGEDPPSGHPGPARSQRADPDENDPPAVSEGPPRKHSL
jgi:hypothetical protein